VNTELGAALFASRPATLKRTPDGGRQGGSAGNSKARRFFHIHGYGGQTAFTPHIFGVWKKKGWPDAPGPVALP